MIEKFNLNTNTIYSFTQKLFITGLIIVLPLTFSTSTIEPVLSIRLLVTSLLLLIVTMLLIFNKNGDILCSKNLSCSVWIGYLFYIIVSGISFFFSTNIFTGIDDLIKIFFLFYIAFLSSVLLHEKKILNFFSLCCVCSSIILSVLGFIQYFYNFKLIPGGWGWPYGTMANGNLHSSALFLMSPFVMYTATIYKGSIKYFSHLTLIAATMNMVYTMTRSVWLAVITSTLAILFLLYLLKPDEILSKEKLKIFRFNIYKSFASVLVGAIIGFVSLNTLVNDEISSNPAPTSSELKLASANERLDLWSKSIEMFKKNPIFGIGLDNWKIEIPKFGTKGMRSDSGNVFFQRPHNDYLWILTETGILGLIGYMMIFIILINYAVRILYQSINIENKYIVLWLIYGCLGYMVISFFSYPRERIFHTILIAMISGIIIGRYRQVWKGINKIQIRKQYFLAPILAVLLSCSWYAKEFYKAEKHQYQIIKHRRSSEWEQCIIETNSARTDLFPLDHTATPVVWYRGVANFSLNNMDEAENDFMQAYLQNPNHAHVLNNLATVHELRGEHNTAEKLYLKATELAPGFDEALINLAAVYYNQKQYSKALLTIERVNPKTDNPNLKKYLDAILIKL